MAVERKARVSSEIEFGGPVNGHMVLACPTYGSLRRRFAVTITSCTAACPWWHIR